MSNKQKEEYMEHQKEIQKEKCEYCKNLESGEGWELLEEDAPHHGASLYCDECGAEYYREYERDIYAENEIAHYNHPELMIIINIYEETETLEEQAQTQKEETAKTDGHENQLNI